MAINSSLISAQPIVQNTDVVIQMLSVRPVPGAQFTPARPAGQICGYYDAGRNLVELYVVTAPGTRFLRVG